MTKKLFDWCMSEGTQLKQITLTLLGEVVMHVNTMKVAFTAREMIL
jgi:hypothetical protein